MPGLQQRLQVAHIELSPQTKKELDERFVLIYTGQRRLARNLLRDVVAGFPLNYEALYNYGCTAVAFYRNTGRGGAC